jgi:hypothetical protein
LGALPGSVLGDILEQISKISMFFDKYSPAGPFMGPAAARNVYHKGDYSSFDGPFVPSSEVRGSGAKLFSDFRPQVRLRLRIALRITTQGGLYDY